MLSPSAKPLSFLPFFRFLNKIKSISTLWGLWIPMYLLVWVWGKIIGRPRQQDKQVNKRKSLLWTPRGQEAPFQSPLQRPLARCLACPQQLLGTICADGASVSVPERGGCEVPRGSRGEAPKLPCAAGKDARGAGTGVSRVARCTEGQATWALPMRPLRGR